MGDVYRDLTDGVICRVTDLPGHGAAFFATDLHDGSFGAPSGRDLREAWELVARGVSEVEFKSMRCACCGASPEGGVV